MRRMGIVVLLAFLALAGQLSFSGCAFDASGTGDGTGTGIGNPPPTGTGTPLPGAPDAAVAPAFDAVPMAPTPPPPSPPDAAPTPPPPPPPPPHNGNGFGEVCMNDGDCTSNVCVFVPGPQGGGRCSEHCTTSKQCPKMSMCVFPGVCSVQPD